MNRAETRAMQARLKEVLDGFDAMVAMTRQTLRRTHPDAGEAQIDHLLRRWRWKLDEPGGHPWTVRARDPGDE